MREKLTEACRGKGSTLFPSFKTVTTCLVCYLCIAVCFGMFVLMYSRDENVFKLHVYALHMICEYMYWYMGMITYVYVY